MYVPCLPIGANTERQVRLLFLRSMLDQSYSHDIGEGYAANRKYDIKGHGGTIEWSGREAVPSKTAIVAARQDLRAAPTTLENDKLYVPRAGVL